MRRRVPEEIMDENGEFVFAYQAEAEMAKLRDALESHGPEGHNATNEQVSALRAEVAKLQKALAYATQDADPEDLVLIKQITEGIWDGPETEAEIAKLRGALARLVDSVNSLPVEDWVEVDRNGDPTLIGYLMQAREEWDAVKTDITTAREALGEARE